MVMDQVIQLAQQGNLEAFNQVVRHYQDDVYRVVLHMVADNDLADDITQEVFISMFKHFHSFRGGNFRAWLMRIATNACLDEFRRQKRQKLLSLFQYSDEGDEIETPSWLVDPAPHLEELLIRQETRRSLLHGLRQLPVKTRLIVVLVDLMGYDYHEVAEILKVPLGTVKSRLGRARLKLRAMLSWVRPDTRECAAPCAIPVYNR